VGALLVWIVCVAGVLDVAEKGATTHLVMSTPLFMSCPRRIDARKLDRALALRRTLRLTYAQVAEQRGTHLQGHWL